MSMHRLYVVVVVVNPIVFKLSKPMTNDWVVKQVIKLASPNAVL